MLNTNPWMDKIKDLNGEKITSFFEKELLLSKLQMSYYPGPDNHIRDKVKVLLDLSNYGTKVELQHVTGVDTSSLAAKKILLLWNLKLTNYTLVN